MKSEFANCFDIQELHKKERRELKKIDDCQENLNQIRIRKNQLLHEQSNQVKMKWG